MTPPHFEPVPNQDLDFYKHMLWSFYVQLRRELVVRFAGIGGTVDNHCLSLFSDWKVLSMHAFYRLCKITWEV
jgi:hypothetical protein